MKYSSIIFFVSLSVITAVIFLPIMIVIATIGLALLIIFLFAADYKYMLKLLWVCAHDIYYQIINHFD